jgi:excisionase family DNA binding protein
MSRSREAEAARTQRRPFVRPSELARHWGVHPRTVTAWIKDGRLPGVRTPGDQFRVRTDDVIGFCEASGLAPPLWALPATRQLLLAGAPASLVRAAKRAARAIGVEAKALPIFDALFSAITSPPDVLLLDARSGSVDIEDAVRALRKSIRATKLLVAFGSTTRTESLLRAGAARVMLDGEAEREIVATALQLV